MEDIESTKRGGHGESQPQYMKRDELFNNLNIGDVSMFTNDKLKKWNSLVDTNSILSEEKRSNIKENFQLFELQVKNNKAIYDRYQGNEKLFLRKILEKLSEKKLLNPNKKNSFGSIDGVKINFIGGDIVMEISDEDMDNLFGESLGGFTTSEIQIDGISLYPVIIRKSCEQKEPLISHELQHFYNQFLIDKSDRIENILGNLLADETIAQTIHPTYGITADDWKVYLSGCLSSGGMNGDSHMSYAFGNRFEGGIEKKILFNQIILTNLDNLDVARELRDAGIENYADILAITPIDKRNELRNIYLNK